MTQFLAKRHTEYISDSREEFPAQENYKMQVDFTISHRFGDSFLYKKSVKYTTYLPLNSIKDYLKSFTILFQNLNPRRLASFGIIPIKEEPTLLNYDATAKSIDIKDDSEKQDQNKKHDDTTECRKKSTVMFGSNDSNCTLARAAMGSEQDSACHRTEMVDMATLISRLVTFQHWPDSSLVSTVPLATFGYYYTGHRDNVKCFKCGLEIEGWSETDDPEMMHRSKNPNCPLLINSTHHQPERMISNDKAQGKTVWNDEKNTNKGNKPETGQTHGGASNYYIPPEDTLTSNTQRVTSEAQLGHKRGATHSVMDNRENVQQTTHLPKMTNGRANPGDLTRQLESTNTYTHENNGLSNGSIGNNHTEPEDTLRTNLPRMTNVRPVRGNSSEIPTSRPQRSTAPNSISVKPNNLPPGSGGHNKKPVVLRTTSDTLNAIVSTNTTTSAENWFSLRDTTESITSQPMDYTIETNRLASFMGNWSLDCCVQPPELAAAGLYYTGPGDRVQCAWCRGGLYGWEEGDTAIGEHRRHFPQCSFIRNKISELVGPVRPTLNENPRSLEEPRKTSSPEKATDNYNSTSKQDKALEIVGQMGYQIGFLEKALEKLKQLRQDISVSNLLDVVFEMENDADDNEEIYATSEGTRASLPPVSEVENNTTGNGNSTTETTNEQNSVGENAATGLGDTQETLTQLTEENKRLKGKMLCKICMDEEVGVLFLPCRHLVCCEDCGAAVKHCPICRTLIVGTVKPFLN